MQYARKKLMDRGTSKKRPVVVNFVIVIMLATLYLWLTTHTISRSSLASIAKRDDNVRDGTHHALTVPTVSSTAQTGPPATRATLAADSPRTHPPTLPPTHTSPLLPTVATVTPSPVGSGLGRELESCAAHGIDLRDRDASMLDHPGGTEAEALSLRRRLQSFQWPLERDQRRIRWRTLPQSQSTPIHGEVSDDWHCLHRLQGTVAHPLAFDSVMQSCPDPSDFKCRIAAYADRLASGGGQHEMCDSIYGASLLKRFARASVELCGGSPSNGSRVACKMVLAHQGHETQTSVCSVENATVDIRQIARGDYPWLQFHRGALSVACDETERGAVVRAAPGTFIHCLADWMELGYQVHQVHSEVPHCSEFDETPTIFVTRSGDYSPFALTHDWLNTVLLMAVEGLRPADVQMVIMDRMGAGFYLPVWQVAFSPSRPLVWFPDLAERPSARCFRRAWFNIPARLSPIYNEDDCGISSGVYQAPLYHVYRDHILQSFGALRVVGRASPTHDTSHSLVVTLIMRRNYATGHSIGRRFGNAEALTKALRDGLSNLRVHGVSNTDASVAVVVNQVDYAAHNFDAQLNISRASDILVAMHGAGLAHAMFLHEWGGVFEFFCPEKPSSNFRYHQLSAKMGLHYDAFSITTEDNVVPIAEALPLVQQLAHRVAESKLLHLSKRG